MMNQMQAIAYGKRNGVKFYVKNTNGGLYGGYKTREQAEEAKARFEKEIADNPFCKGENIRVYIEEAA